MEGRSNNFYQALWLGVSQMSRILLTFLTGALLSRYLSKSDYGTYKQVLYVYTTLNVLFTAGLANVFPYFIPRYTVEEAKNIVNKVTKVLLVLGLMFSLFIYLFSDSLASLLNNQDLAQALRYFSLAPLFTLPSLGIEGLYTALKRTQYIVIYQILSLLMILLCSTCPVVFLGGNYNDAIIGWVVASFITFLIALWMKNWPYKKIKEQIIPQIYKKIFDYSLPLMGASIAGLFYHSASQFFISRYCGQENFAEYSNGYISLPFLALFAGSIKTLLVPIFSKAYAEKTMSSALKTYENSVMQGALLTCPFIFFSFIFAADIIGFIYGLDYVTSAKYFRLSLIHDLFCILPYYSILLATGKTRFYFYVHVVSAIMIWGVDFFIANVFDVSAYGFALIYTLILILNTTIMMYYVNVRLEINILGKSMCYGLIKILSHLIIISVVIFCISQYLLTDYILLVRLIFYACFFFMTVIITGHYCGLPYYLNIIKRFKNK